MFLIFVRNECFGEHESARLLFFVCHSHYLTYRFFLVILYLLLSLFMKTEWVAHVWISICILLGFIVVNIASADISSQKYENSILPYKQEIQNIIKSGNFFDELSQIKEFLSAQVRNKQAYPELYNYKKVIFNHQEEYVRVLLYYTYPNALGIITEYKQEFLFTQEGRLVTELIEKK